MQPRIKLVEDPSELLQLIEILTSNRYKLLIQELSRGWRTLQELEQSLGFEVKPMLEKLRRIGMIELRWVSSRGNPRPELQYQLANIRVRANFTSTLEELIDLVYVFLLEDLELKQIIEHIVELVKAGNSSLSDLCRQTGLSSHLLRAIIRRSDELIFRGNRVELVEGG